jgi:hypothetical protein
MAFSGATHYPVPVEAVAACFVDPAVVRARYDAAGDRDLEVLECGADGDDLVIHTRRTVDVEGLRSGTFTIDVKGAPVKIRGTMRLEPADGGTRHTVRGEFSVSVPLVGGRIAAWAEGPAQQRLEAEFAFHAARLAD